MVLRGEVEIEVKVEVKFVQFIRNPGTLLCWYCEKLGSGRGVLAVSHGVYLSVRFIPCRLFISQSS